MTTSKLSVFIELERLRHKYVGLYSFCENLGKGMSSLTSIEPSLFVPKSHVEYFSQKGAKCIIRTPFHKIKSPVKEDFDVVHITHQFSKYMPRSHPNMIFTIHDLNFLYTGDPAKRVKVLNEIQRKVDKASVIVSISDFVMKDLQKHLDLSGKKLERVYNGVRLETYGHFDEPSYRPLKPFLFSIGVLQMKKNMHVLPGLLVGNDYELLLAGKITESYLEKIKEEAKRHGVSQRVKILGTVSDEEKYWYFKNCKAYLQPSLSEGFGLPVIEAMSMGKPVFISDKTCLPEIGGKEAYYFNDFDPESMRNTLEVGMEEYVSDPEKEVALKNRAELFTWERACHEYEKIYHESIS